MACFLLLTVDRSGGIVTTKRDYVNSMSSTLDVELFVNTLAEINNVSNDNMDTFKEHLPEITHDTALEQIGMDDDSISYLMFMV